MLQCDNGTQTLEADPKQPPGPTTDSEPGGHRPKAAPAPLSHLGQSPIVIGPTASYIGNGGKEEAAAISDRRPPTSDPFSSLFETLIL